MVSTSGIRKPLYIKCVLKAIKYKLCAAVIVRYVHVYPH